METAQKRAAKRRIFTINVCHIDVTDTPTLRSTYQGAVVPGNLNKGEHV
jgi:hypothetical protein